MEDAVSGLVRPTLAQILKQRGLHSRSGSWTVYEVPSAGVLCFLQDDAASGEADGDEQEPVVSFKAALTAASASANATTMTIQTKSGKVLSGLDNSMQALPNLSKLQLVTSAGTLDPVSLGLTLNKLQQLQDLYLEFKPGASPLDPSQGSLLAVGMSCFQRLKRLHLRAGDDLMQSIWPWLQTLTQLSSLEVSPGSKVTAGQLACLAAFTSLSRFVVLGSPSGSSSSNSPFLAAAALPTLPHVVSGGGEVPVWDLMHLIRALPNALELQLDVICKGHGARPTGTDNSSRSSSSNGMFCSETSEIKQALLAMRQPGQVQSLRLHTYQNILGGSGGLSAMMPTPVAVVAECLPNLQHLECAPCAENEEDGQHLAPGLLANLTSLVCGTPSVLGSSKSATSTNTSSSSRGTSITASLMEACSGLVQLEGRGVTGFDMSGLAAGALTALTSLDLEGAAATAGSCSIGVVPLELLRLPRLVRLALVRLLLPQDAANPLAHILPSTMQAVQVILDAMPEPGALLNQVYQLLLLEGDHISRQLTLAPQLPCSPPLEDACATFGPQEVTPLDLTSPTLLQDVVAAFLGHEAGVAGLELGQRQAGGGAGLAGRHQAPHVSDAFMSLRSAYGSREELLSALQGVILKVQGAGARVALLHQPQPQHQQQEGRSGQLEVGRSGGLMLANTSQASGKLQLTVPEEGGDAAGASGQQKKRRISPRAAALDSPLPPPRHRGTSSHGVSGLPVSQASSAAGVPGCLDSSLTSSSPRRDSLWPSAAAAGQGSGCSAADLAARPPPAMASTSQVPATLPRGTDLGTSEAELDMELGALYDADAAGASGGVGWPGGCGLSRRVGTAGTGQPSSSSWRTQDQSAVLGPAAAAAAAAGKASQVSPAGQLGSRMGANLEYSLVPALRAPAMRDTSMENDGWSAAGTGGSAGRLRAPPQTAGAAPAVHMKQQPHLQGISPGAASAGPAASSSGSERGPAGWPPMAATAAGRGSSGPLQRQQHHPHPAAPAVMSWEQWAAPRGAGASAECGGRQHRSAAAGKAMAPPAPLPPAAAAAEANAAGDGCATSLDPRMMRFVMEHPGKPSVWAEEEARLRKEDEAAEKAPTKAGWDQWVANTAAEMRATYQAQLAAGQGAMAAGVQVAVPVAGAAAVAAGAAAGGLQAPVPGVALLPPVAAVASGHGGNRGLEGQAEQQQEEAANQQQPPPQQPQQQQVVLALMPEADAMDMDAEGAAAPAILLCHKGKVVKILDLAASGSCAREVLLGLIGDASEQLLYWYASPRLQPRNPDLHKYRYVGRQLLEALTGLLRAQVVRLTKRAWEDLSAQEVLGALGQVLKQVVRVWWRQKEYMALFSSSTDATHVTWTLGLAPCMVRKGKAPAAAAHLVQTVQQKKPTRDTTIEASRGTGPWALASLGQLVRRAPHAKDMQFGVVHLSHITAETASKEKLVEGAGLVGAVFLVHVDRLYTCIGVPNKLREDAVYKKMDNAGEELLKGAYKGMVGDSSGELETALQRLWHSHKPHLLPMFSMENVAREVRQESSNRLGSAFAGHGLEG